MINRLILVEGVNDLNFIDWLSEKAKINYTNTKLLRVHNGKDGFVPYITKNVFGRVNDIENNIDYALESIDAILIIKDFDKDDLITEFDDLIRSCKSYNIDLDVYYIAGTDSPPKLLETIFIQNDGELLKQFAGLVNKFNEDRKRNCKEHFDKINDKVIYHGFRKLQNKKIDYKANTFSSMFEDDFLELTDITRLLEKIRRFIKYD